MQEREKIPLLRIKKQYFLNHRHQFLSAHFKSI
ncbi:hypothetical protein BSNT_07781 [Bacillus subtilis subsp. natto BEST195]|nr:hypothetical protein BSNT_07781 [Bacillus subtilis subsp. natto BEST195]